MINLNKDEPLAAVMSAAVDAMIVIDQKGIIQKVSDSVTRLFEYLPEECIGENISIFMPEPDRSAHDGYMANYMSGGRAKIIGIGRETVGRKKSGVTFPIHLSVGEFQFRGARYFVGICHDLSEYNKAITELRETQQRYKDVVESQRHYICRVDRTFKVTFANASFVKALGVSHGDVLGVSLMSIISEGEETLSGSLGELFNRDDVDEITVKVSMKSRGLATLAEWSFRKTTKSSGADEIQGVGIDISEKEAAIQQAEYLRDHDHLTGLLNTQSLITRMSQAVEPEQLYAVMRVDIIRFGQVNQRYGYAVGDSLLVEVSRRIKECVPTGAWLARPGGDEFLVAFKVGDPDDALIFASKLMDSLTRPYHVDGDAHVLNCKAGVALFPFDHDELARIPELTEAALRDAKSHNEPVVFFSGQSHNRLLRQIMVEQELEKAIRDQSIEVYLQPKIVLATSATHSYEALARWKHDELGQVSPAEFIPIAESSGLAPELDRYIVSRVTKLIAEASAGGKSCPPIAVNITADHFSDDGLFTYITEALDEYSLPPSAIELEITERAIVNLSTTVSDNLRRLRERGMKVSIDDFGTGYSSLSYLRILDIDELKIDKSFIDDIEDPKGYELVKAVISLAHAFGLSVTAEGIETGTQAELLIQMGCELGQGYFFSRPLPVSQHLHFK